MLAVNILWVVVGVIYVIYRLLKDGDSEGIGIALAIMLLPIFFIIVSHLPDSSFFMFVFGIICIFSPILVIFILIMLYSHHKDSHLEEASKILTLFHQYGYKDVLLEDMELFFTKSPPRLVKSPYYDEKKKSIYDMWDWLCKEKTYELVNKENYELSQIIGLDIEDIPLNSELQIKEAYLQRKCKVVDYILSQRGLVYRRHFGGELEYNLINAFVEYNHVFDNYIRNYNSEHH